MRNKGFEDCIR